MTRRRPHSPAPDRASRRSHWRRFAQACAAAAAGEAGLGPDGELARTATLARDGWPWPVDFPEGIAFSTLAHAAWAFGRAPAGPAQLRLAPTLSAAAACALDLLDLTETASSTASDEPGSGVAARLPYAED